MNHLAQFGTVNPPPGISRFSDGRLEGLPQFINVILKTLIVIAGLYALINFVLAGYSFLSAGGDPKKIQDAWAKIWQSIIGLLISAGAFVIAAIVGLLLFGDTNAILQFRIFEPPSGPEAGHP